VIASNYCTLAKLSSQDFKFISIKHPRLVKEMKEQIFAYDDDIKVFMEYNLKKISYLKNLDIDTFHEILFNFKQETFDKGTILYHEKEKNSKMYVVKSGIVEITIKVEGFNMAVERLYRGSVFNHRSFLLND
jgi:hypothetical protein